MLPPSGCLQRPPTAGPWTALHHSSTTIGSRAPSCRYLMRSDNAHAKASNSNKWSLGCCRLRNGCSSSALARPSSCRWCSSCVEHSANFGAMSVSHKRCSTSSNPILQSNLSTAQVWPRRAAIFLRHGDGKGTPGHVSCRPSWGASRSKTTSDAQSSNGSFTKIVSSRSGLVDSSVTGHSISSSMWRTYFTACAGSSLHLRAPFVDCDQPSRHS